jgi:hypothetical protein
MATVHPTQIFNSRKYKSFFAKKKLFQLNFFLKAVARVKANAEDT